MPILDPATPLAARIQDRVRPPRKWWPIRALRRRQREAIRLRTLKKRVRQREHIRRPLKQIIVNRGSGRRPPDRRRRRLVREGSNVIAVVVEHVSAFSVSRNRGR